MEEKIIELYDLDEDSTSRLRREANISRTSFIIKLSKPLSRETVGMFIRILNACSQEDLEALNEAKRKCYCYRGVLKNLLFELLSTYPKP